MTLEALFALVLSFALLTKGGPVEPEYDVTHIQTAYDCPPYDSYGYHLLARKLGCNDDKPMHCAYLLGSERFTVRCLKPKLCTQGQQPFIQDRSDTVSCGFCSGDTYHSAPSQPSYSYSKCTHMTKLTKGRILCEHLELRTSDPDYHKYNRYIRCNILEGYILDDPSVSDPSRDRLGYCTNATDPRCIKYSCKEGMELIKNYSCVKNCSSDEYREKNFTCVKRQSGPSTTPGRPVVIKDRSSTQPVTQATEPMKSEPIYNTETIKVIAEIFLPFGTFVMAVVAGLLFYWNRGRIRQCWKNRKGFPNGRQPSVDHPLHEVHSEPTNNDQPNTKPDDSGDRAVSSPLLSKVQIEHADQPNQKEDPPFGSRDDNTDDHQEKRPRKAMIINEAKNQYIRKQVIHVHSYNHGKEWKKTKDEEASDENSDSDRDRSLYKHPTPETGADDKQSHQLNLANLDKHPCPETGADDQQSHQLNRDNGVNQDDLGPSPRTLKDLMDNLEHIITSEEKVDAILNLFGQLHKEERNRWEAFCKYCIWIHEHANMLPRLPHERRKPTITQITYRNTPEGFTAFESSGRHNSCLYQSVSLLLVGDESQYKLLRLMTTVFAARNFVTAAKQIMTQLDNEGKDVHHFYVHHLDKRAYEELRAKEQHEQNVEEWNKIYLQELIMETPVLNTMSSQIHAVFLCGAIGMPICQHLQAGHDNHMFLNDLDPIACFSDKSYDESLPKLNIMWVNSENDLNKEINHVVPLWKEERKKSNCVGQSTEVTATKGGMVTLEDNKHNIEKSVDDSENDDESNGDNNENFAINNVEKEPFIPAGSMPL